MGLMDEDSLIDKLRDGVMGALHDPDLSRGLQQRDLALRLVAHNPARTVVQFRKLPKTHRKGKKNVDDQKDVFILELGYRDLYSDIVGRVANILHMHPMRIRLGRHYCYSNIPIPLDPQIIRLSDLLKMSYTICNVLYYEVLPDPYKHDLSKLYEFSGIVDDIEAHYRHEDQPQEEFEFKDVDRKYRVELYHFTMTDGEPVSKKLFITVTYHANETFAEVKERLHSQLGIDMEEITKRKFAVLRLQGQPKYLEDTKLVLAAFLKDNESLGLEGHVDEAVTFTDRILE